jgi:hypothetical protein
LQFPATGNSARKNKDASMNQELGEESKDKSVNVTEVSAERVITIRCLSAIPEEVEALLAEITAAEQDEK